MAGLLVGLALAAALGGGDGETATAESSPRAATYLASVEALIEQEAAALGGMDALLTGSYTDRQAWLAAVAGAAEAIPSSDRTLTAARELAAPRGYEAAHRAWLTALERREILGGVLTGAIARGDALSASIAAQRFWRDLGAVLLAAPPPLCRLFAPAATILLHEEEFCRDPSTLPGGEYGQRLREITRHLAVELFPRTGVPPPFLTSAEELAYLTLIHPETEPALRQALAEVAELEPPGALAEDHQVLLGFLTDLAGVGREMTLAVESGDVSTVRRLSDRANGLADAFARRLSEQGRDLLMLLLLE